MLSILRGSALLVLLLSLASFASEPDLAADARPAVTGIRAYLFEFRTGNLSKNITDPSHPGLGNTIADARSTLVVVEVSGPPVRMENEKSYAVRLVATETLPKPKKLLDQSQLITPRSDKGKTYLAFLINPGGCDPVKLTATIAGPPPKQNPFETVLDFHCGE